MSKFFFILILITQINYLFLSPSKTFKKKNLQKPKKKKERKLDDRSDDIVIIHLNDVHCGLNDSIGYDGFVLYRKELQKEYKHVLSVDVGDHIQGGALGAITEGEAIIEVINKVEFNVTTIGNHEFDYGIEQLYNLSEKITPKYINLNTIYRRTKTRIFEPSTIIEVGGKKIGFIGIVTPLTFSRTYISTIRETDGTPVYNFLSDREEMNEAVQKEIDKLRNEGVDYVILVAHVGMYDEEYTTDLIISNISGVDAVLDGHTHLVYNTTVKDKDNKDIHIAQTGTKLVNIGKLIIKTDGTILSENIAEVPEPIDKKGAKKIYRNWGDRWVDEEMNEFINQITEKYSDELNHLIGHSDYDLIIKPEDNSDVQAIYCRFKECTLGNLIADAFKETVNADISIVNGGAVRANLLKGDVTRKNVIDMMPFFNNLLVKEITGQAFLDALELGVSQLPISFGGFPQVSGCSYYVNTSFNSTVELDKDGMFVKVGGKRRVTNVKINGRPLISTKKYLLAASDFILNGGDGFTMFAEFPTVNESIYTDSDAIGYYIQNNLEANIPSKYVDLQDRINMDKEPEDLKEEIAKIDLVGEFLKKNKKYLVLLILILM